MKLLLLRGLLLVDSAILFLLGGLLVFAPARVEQAFHFADLPPAVAYLIGMWGCLMATMGFGYLVAATHPLRYRVWINIAIIRGAVECALGIVYLSKGTITFQQAGLGTLVAGVLALAYVVLYPRLPHPVAASPTPVPSA
jgi:4-amino-4-deoxy-L-arabinose transferase-like glycosyltransferase